jgi:quercetin dioxygenase-like cupin family protein
MAPAEPQARHIEFGAADLKLWGDPVSGQVNDWIFHLGERICHLVFSIPPGRRFTQSDAWRPIYGADEVYYVLGGNLALANPQTGEVVRAGPGEVIRFHPNTWHHGFSVGPDELRVLEFFAPALPGLAVPEAGDGYGMSQPGLGSFRYVQDELLERWPTGADDAAAAATLHPVRPSDILWRMEGRRDPVLVGIFLSTPSLTVARIDLLPGRSSDIRQHGGDLALYVLEGRLNVLLPDAAPVRWFELAAGDGFFAPAGTPHRYVNVTSTTVRVLAGVAPAYLAERT